MSHHGRSAHSLILEFFTLKKSQKKRNKLCCCHLCLIYVMCTKVRHEVSMEEVELGDISLKPYFISVWTESPLLEPEEIISEIISESLNDDLRRKVSMHFDASKEPKRSNKRFDNEILIRNVPEDPAFNTQYYHWFFSFFLELVLGTNYIWWILFFIFFHLNSGFGPYYLMFKKVMEK